MTINYSAATSSNAVIWAMIPQLLPYLIKFALVVIVAKLIMMSWQWFAALIAADPLDSATAGDMRDIERGYRKERSERYESVGRTLMDP